MSWPCVDDQLLSWAEPFVSDSAPFSLSNLRCTHAGILAQCMLHAEQRDCDQVKGKRVTLMDTTRSILVVDGSESMIAMLRRFLQQQGVHVWTAESVPAAKTLLAQHLSDVVLTDLFLPHRNGLRLLQHVRHIEPHTRVVMMVAFGTPNLHQHLLTEGAYACLAKPFRLQQLWHVLLQTWPPVSPQPEPPEPPPTPTSTPAHDASYPCGPRK